MATPKQGIKAVHKDGLDRLYPFKTQVIQKTLNPTWNQSFHWTIYKEVRALEIAMYDEDKMSKDDFMVKNIKI